MKQSGKWWFTRLFPFLVPVPLFALLAAGPLFRELPISDFGIFHYAARMVMDGHGRLLYDFHEQRLYQILCDRPQSLFFYYPGAIVLPFLPLARLPIGTAIVIWDTLSLLIVIGCAIVFTRDRSADSRMACAVATFAFAPLLYLILDGQTTALILLPLTGAWLQWRNGREFRGGLCLAFGLLKFQLIAGLVAFLLLRCRWRALAGVALGAFLLYLVSAAIAGPAWVLHEAQLSVVGEHSGGVVSVMPNLHGLIFCLTGSSHAPIVLVLSAGVLLLALRTTRNTERDFCVALLASLLVSWHMNPHDLLLVLVPVWLSDRLGLPAWAVVFATVGLVVSSWMINFRAYGFMGLPLLLLFLAMVSSFPVAWDRRRSTAPRDKETPTSSKCAFGSVFVGLPMRPLPGIAAPWPVSEIPNPCE